MEMQAGKSGFVFTSGEMITSHQKGRQAHMAIQSQNPHTGTSHTDVEFT